MNTIDCYVDGSVIDGKARWGLIVVSNNSEVWRECGELEGEINSMRQIGGELKASIQAIAYARKNKLKARIFYDYLGVYFWVRDFFEFTHPWQAKNEWAQKYRTFVKANRQYVHSFIKVKAHSNDKFNDLVDELARTLGN